MRSRPLAEIEHLEEYPTQEQLGAIGPLVMEGGSLEVPLLTGRALWSAIRSGTIRTRNQDLLSLTAARERVATLMSNLWADSTMKQRRQLVERWVKFCEANHLPLTDETALLFILSIPDLAPQGQIAYAKALSGTFRHLGWQRQELLTAITALRAQGAEIPIEQATPITKEHVMQLLQVFKDLPLLQLSMVVAWKTASRWGEVALLTRRHFLVVDRKEVIIGWGTLPKGWRSQPFHPSMYTVIVGSGTIDIFNILTNHVKDDEPFCPWDTSTLDSKLSRLEPPLNQYSGHSFKKGAASQVVAAAAGGAQIEPHHLSLLLKHKLTMDLLSASDLRYPKMGPDLARWLGTQKVTKLL